MTRLGARIIVTGGRGYSSEPVIATALQVAAELDTDHAPTLLHGGASGADAIAARLAQCDGWWVETYRADWRAHGRAAGPIRNRRMVTAGADVCLAFFSSGVPNRGTRQCVALALAAGIPVVPHDEQGPLTEIPKEES